MRTYRDTYPCGRKSCSYCKRWRHAVDFGVRKWADLACTVPRTLSSVCRHCAALKRRLKKGYRPRNWYPHGTPASKRYHLYRLARNRATHHQRYRDPQYRAALNEYGRIWYNGHNQTVSNSYNTVDLGRVPKVDRTAFDQFIGSLGLSFLELQRRTGLDDRVFRSKAPKVLLTTVDQAFTRLGYPEMVAVLYPS